MILQLQKRLTNISKTVDLKLRNNFLCEIPGNHPRIIQISKPSLKKCNFSFSFKTSALTDIENEKRVQAQIKDPIHLIYQQFFFLSMFSLTINHDLQDSRGRGGAISLIPLYDFHLLHRHVDISQAITTGSSPLRIASNWT